MSKHRPATPTTTDTSDLLNEIYKFVDDNPNWYEDSNLMAKMAIALSVLKIACPDPNCCTDEEYAFVTDLCKTLNESMT